ncbi:MAG: hypothetical protein IJ071_08940 [Ruminococcus sp.]|nr:hypothetical protein [Ruminococcus sp.]
MDYKRLIAGALAFAMAATAASCSDSSSSSESSSSTEATEAATEAPEPVTEAPTEELLPPVPAEATDPNAVIFDSGVFPFATPKTIDDDSAQGELEVVEVQGNKMLRFTDDGSNFANGTVQKIQIDAAMLLSPEDLAKVRSIELDAYADATADKLATEDADAVKAPGWVGGGGGANVAGDKWYQFAEWDGGEYNFDMSGPAHVQFKFLMADGGQCWDETMSEATFLVMRWGAQNEGNFYIDNIVFYDADGNSLPVRDDFGFDVDGTLIENGDALESEVEEIEEEVQSEVEEAVESAEEAAESSAE